MTDPKWLRPGLEFAAAHASEELGEVVKEAGELSAALGKLQRWGPMSVNPDLKPEDQESNIAWVRRKRRDLSRELLDLEQALDRLDSEVNKHLSVRDGYGEGR